MTNLLGPRDARRLGAIAVVVLFALALPAALATRPAHAFDRPISATHPATAVVPASHPSLSHPSAGPVSSGRGTFFDNRMVPNASTSHLTCYVGTCVNVSNDPSINWTSNGAIAVAYTAWTNASPCLAAIPYAQSEVGFVVSTNGGSSWSAPKYLGAPSTCSSTVAQAEPDAWQPSLTSLSNGTLVLVYVAFNTSGPLASLSLGPVSYTVTTDRLLLTESYDNGTTWTSPQTLNVSDNPSLTSTAFTAERPWATATGNTVYVTWMNATAAPGFAGGIPTASSAVQILASTNGGTSWPSSPTELPVVQTTGNPGVALNPNAIVLPNGQLTVAYATNFSYHTSYGCQNGTCLSGIWEADVVAASSTNNGTTFSSVTVGSSELVVPSRYVDAFLDPSPQLAYGPSSHQIVVVFSAGEVLTACSGGVCSPYRDPEVVFVANSSNAGSTWSASHPVLPQLYGYGLFGTFYPSFAYNPSVTIDRNGTVDLVFTYDNYTLCQPTLTFGTFCGPQQEEFAQSSDNGTTFSGPVEVSSDWTQLFNNPSVPDGEYATTIAAGGQLWIAWTLDVCPGWASPGFFAIFPTSACMSEITLSQLFNGAGVTVTFSESGLANGIRWDASVMGNDRVANAPTSLSVSGVPTSVLLDWTVSTNITASYGDRYSGVPSSTSPQTFASSTTISVAFAQQYLLDVTTVPNFPAAVAPYVPYCFTGYPATAWNDPTCATMNYNVTVTSPALSSTGPGAAWVTPGSSVVLNVSKIGSYYCTVGVGFCYDNDVLNLSFQSWSGTGNGSVNTTSNFTSVVVNGPVNETASFLFIGYCYVDYQVTPASSSCLQANTTLTFHETGLPNGTTWNVSVASMFGSTTASNTTPWMPIVGAPTIGPAYFQVWTVPATGGYWVPSTNPLSPVQIPAQGLVNVNFTFVASLSAFSFPLTVSTSGLPDGLPWSYSLNTSSFGVSTGNSTVTTAGAGSYSVTGGAVQESNGTEYVVTGIDVRSDVVNQSSWTNGTAPGTVTIHGPAEVVLVYTPRYWLEVDATVGGVAGPASAWFGPGAAVVLSENASPGYHFVSWAGTGSGATGGSQNTQTSPTIHTMGPITELANFVQNASLLDTVTVSALGLPAGTAYSFTLGSRGFTTNGTLIVSGFADGSYSFRAQNVTALATGEIGRVDGFTSTYAANANGTLALAGDGSIQVNYTVLDMLTTSVVGNGTITPGSGWFVADSVVTVTATSDAGWQFAGLSTMLPSTVVPLTNGTFQVQVDAPGTVVAEFTPIPVGPTPTYSLTVNATGLPLGVEWNVSAGAYGTGGSGGSLTISGLAAGSYTVTAATVYVGTGTRYVPTTGSPTTVTVPSASGATVAFTTEYDLAVVAGAGGTAGPVTAWVAAGTDVTLTASANTTDVFVNWTGSGIGSYSGTSPSPKVTVNGPISEVATFGPAPSSGTTGSGSSGSAFPWLGVLLLVALLVLGAIVGLILGRRSGGARPRAEPSEVREANPPTESVYGGPGPEPVTDEAPGTPPE